MLAAAYLPFAIFCLLALAPQLASDDEPLDEDALPDEDPLDPTDPIDPTDPTDPDPEDPDAPGEDPAEGEPDPDGGEAPEDDIPDDEDPEAGDPAPEDPGPQDPAPQDPETVTVVVTDQDGNQTDVVVDAENAAVTGTEGRDVFEAPDDSPLSYSISGLGGDDTLAFGFGVDADGGEGSDALALTLTDVSLANTDLSAGVIELSDTADALAIEVESGVVGFVHEIRIGTSTEVDGAVTQSEAIFYVLSPDSILGVDTDASAASGEPVLTGEGLLLVQVGLGAQTTVTTTDADGNDIEQFDGAINADPQILLNREVASVIEI